MKFAKETAHEKQPFGSFCDEKMILKTTNII